MQIKLEIAICPCGPSVIRAYEKESLYTYGTPINRSIKPAAALTHQLHPYQRNTALGRSLAFARRVRRTVKMHIHVLQRLQDKKVWLFRFIITDLSGHTLNARRPPIDSWLKKVATHFERYMCASCKCV